MACRRAWPCLFAVAALAGLAPARSRAAAPFEGEFVSGDGERLSLRQHGDRVDGSLEQGGMRAAVAGTIQAGVLRGTVHFMGQAVKLAARPAGSGLRVELEGEGGTTTFERRGTAAPARAPPEAAGPGAKPDGLAPPAAGAGRVHLVEHEGWSVLLPPGWDVREKDGVLALGSGTEAGLLVVRVTAQRDPELLRAGLGEDLAGAGLAGVVPALQASKNGRGLHAEFHVTASDGAALRLRAVAVVGERLTVAVLGTTTAEKMGRLRQRVDEMARSVRFFAPKVSPGQQFVAGEWWSYSSAGIGATGGTEATLAFCPDGRYFSSSESSYGGGAGTAGAWGIAGRRQGGGGARWTAAGTRTAGRVTVRHADGTTSEIGWRTQPGGDGVYFDGRLYGRTGERKYCR